MKLRAGVKIRACLCAASFILLVGCGSGGSLGAPTATTTGAAKSVYVMQESISQVGVGTVLRFPASANGSVQPEATLNVLGQLAFMESVGVDESGHIYVAGRDYNVESQIVEYGAGATGTMTPVGTARLGPLSYKNPGAMTFDSEGNLYVGADDEIAVFSPGSASPARVIAGSLTQIVNLAGIAVDGQGAIYVTNDVNGFTGIGSVLVFSSGATGNVAPIRTIDGSGSSTLYDPGGIAIDSDGNIFVAAYLTLASSPAEPSSIFEFAPGASGYATPLKTISGSATGLKGIGSLKIDGAGNLYALVLTQVTTSTGIIYQPSVATFAATAAGNVAPVRSFTSTGWNAPGYGQMGLE